MTCSSSSPIRNSVAASAETKSMPMSRPSPRTSVTRCGQWAVTASAARSRTCGPSSRVRSIRPSDLMAPIVAVTAAAASGLPANVEECSSGSAFSGANSCADATTPPTGITPPPRILPREQHVRGDAGEVSAPPGAEPAHAGLDLVEDHHGAGLGARLPDLPQVAVGRQPDAALGLDGLEQHHRLGPSARPAARRGRRTGRSRPSGSSGPNGSRYCGCPVTDSAPSVLPWNPPCMAIT